MNEFFRRLRRLTPRWIKLFFMKRFFGLMPDERKPGRSVAHNRIVLAARYLHGEGIEIGALGRSLPLPRGARAKQVDRMSKEELLKQYPGTAKKRRTQWPDIVDNGETLGTISDASQDFVVANHVIEHFQNPISFLHNTCRVLKDGGILFLAIPDKEKTFDHNRPVTPFEHLVEDFDNGAQASRESHFREFVRLADMSIGAGAWATEAECEAQVHKLMEQDYSIHFHVWDKHAMMEMVLRASDRFGLPLVPEAMLSTGDEVIFILEKVSDSSTAI